MPCWERNGADEIYKYKYFGHFTRNNPLRKTILKGTIQGRQEADKDTSRKVTSRSEQTALCENVQEG